MPSPTASLAEIETLCAAIGTDSQALLRHWADWQIQPSYLPSAENLAAYLALRRYDLRPLQHDLMELGLSSLGRLESRVMR